MGCGCKTQKNQNAQAAQAQKAVEARRAQLKEQAAKKIAQQNAAK